MKQANETIEERLKRYETNSPAYLPAAQALLKYPGIQSRLNTILNYHYDACLRDLYNELRATSLSPTIIEQLNDIFTCTLEDWFSIIGNEDCSSADCTKLL